MYLQNLKNHFKHLMRKNPMTDMTIPIPNNSGITPLDTNSIAPIPTKTKPTIIKTIIPIFTTFRTFSIIYSFFELFYFNDSRYNIINLEDKK